MGKKEDAQTTEAKPEINNDVSAKTSDSDRVVTVTYDFGKDMATSVEKFGENVVHSKFVQSAIIDLQSLIRRLLKAGKTDDEINAEVSGWKPGAKVTVRKSGKEKALDALGSLSEEDRAAILAQYS